MSQGESRARILCVEDEPVIRSALLRVLRRAGYAVAEASDGRAGLEAIRAERPDLVLCDVTMPIMDGFELLAAVRSGLPEEGADLPFVFLSALGDPRDIAEGRRRGADGYVTKPVDFDALIATIERCLGARRRGA